MSQFDLTRVLTGSEGTLAFITEARLDITRLPKVRRLVNVKYNSFDSALRNAPFMVEARALSVETVDSKVLNRPGGYCLAFGERTDYRRAG